MSLVADFSSIRKFRAGLFPCQQCQRVYKYSDSLARHLRLECNIQPQFQCPLCEYKARQKIHLSHHMISKHQACLKDFET